MIDFAYLNFKLERTPTVSARQHYVTNLVRDKGLPLRDRREVIRYVQRRPDLFVPFDEVNGTPIENEIAKKRNGPDARFDFRDWIKTRLI
ncbi:MAG: hypothetical protein IKQ67_07290 [Candidatus Methanomethylophilaceae archaeon]|nr:hypothetical protein [Candidatus Methanomethylophilaceae archaeon]